MSDIDRIINELFYGRWEQIDTIERMRLELYNLIQGQINGDYCDYDEYQIMIQGGFIMDGYRGTNKKLTVLGEIFIKGFELSGTQ